VTEGQNRLDAIRQCLASLSPTHVALVDDSARHAGHAGAASGGGHYQLTIVSEQFAGQSRVARHRAVFAALTALMQRDIHALSIVALTPDEFAPGTRA
jgi:BolA family transcriptional regulator, general stress-responsive regulator